MIHKKILFSLIYFRFKIISLIYTFINIVWEMIKYFYHDVFKVWIVPSVLVKCILILSLIFIFNEKIKYVGKEEWLMCRLIWLDNNLRFFKFLFTIHILSIQISTIWEDLSYYCFLNKRLDFITLFDVKNFY